MNTKKASHAGNNVSAMQPEIAYGYKDMEERVERLRRVGLAEARTKESAIAALFSTGFYTKKGNLKKKYR